MSVRLPGIGSKAIALVATLFVLVAASVVMDRLGAPPPLIRTLVLIVSAVSIGMAGALTRTVRGSTYLGAGQRLGSVRGTSAALVAAMGILFTAGAAGFSDPALPASIALGLLLHSVLMAAPLQRAGVASLGALASGRYRSGLLSFVVGLIIFVLASGLALKTGALAIIALKPATGLAEPLLRVSTATLVLLAILPGGYASLAAASVIVVLLAFSGVAASSVGIWSQQEAPVATAVQSVLYKAAGAELTPEIGAAALAFAGLLAALGTAPTCRSPGIARHCGAAAMLMFSALACATAALGQIDASWAPDNADGLALAASLRLPAPIAVLLALMPGLFLTGLLAALARAGASALVHDALGALGQNRSAMSSRLAFHRLAVIAIVLVASSGRFPLPELQTAWLRGVLTVAATLPSALIVPALLRSGDWRAACVAVTASLGLSVLTASEVVVLPVWQVAAIFLGAMSAALLLFRSSAPEDAQAADVLTGRSDGPLILVPNG